MSLDRARFESSIHFAAATVCVEPEEAGLRVRDALERVLPRDAESRLSIHRELMSRFPDEASPADFWHSEASRSFRDFFLWGHDYDWGPGCRRLGAMGPRHILISTESIARGFLPVELTGKRVLDIGCWSGGDLLILRGLGADVEAIEEHRRSADSARGLCERLGINAPISTASFFADRLDWKQRFDLIYCSGVIYHVTDPVLFLRLCFSYLNIGGKLVVETKALREAAGLSVCGYSGTLEKGWNWFAPSWDVLGRWLVDAGFETADVHLHERSNGRLLAGAQKTRVRAMVETAGFSRPGSWLEGEV